MDFKAFNKSVLDFFTTGIPVALTALETENEITLPRPNVYTEDVPDLKRSESIIFWMILSRYGYEELSNESKELNAVADCFVTFKNVKAKSADDLQEIAKNYMTALYELVQQNPELDGVADYAMISEMVRYDAAEGFETAKAISFTLNIYKEV